jgi:hypothetical protein
MNYKIFSKENNEKTLGQIVHACIIVVQKILPFLSVFIEYAS